MPTSYPKSSPTEMLGLLVLLNSHKGAEDIALLADDLDLEIDEILPALDNAELLGLVKVTDGRATFTDLGRRFISATIRERKEILREQLKRTTLFKTLLRALENAPERYLTDEQLVSIVAFIPGPSDEAAQSIINWGRYAELFRYDPEEHRLLPVRRPTGGKGSGGTSRPPPPASPATPARAASAKSTGTAPERIDPPTTATA
ncbi:MAG TPA: AAA-associated domain-containing protein [Thermoplasmata archaeon]|nr:AAA-associated domain-containing protein [Thermoplasmata archaeon]